MDHIELEVNYREINKGKLSNLLPLNLGIGEGIKVTGFSSVQELRNSFDILQRRFLRPHRVPRAEGKYVYGANEKKLVYFIGRVE
jgi:hypothetical protein